MLTASVSALLTQNRLESMISKEVGRGLTEFLFSFFYFDVPRCKGQIKSRSLIEPWMVSRSSVLAEAAIESYGARVFRERQAEPGLFRVTSDRYIV